MRPWKLVCLAFLAHRSCVEAEDYDIIHEVKLRATLFEKYEREMLPRKNATDNINITTTIYLKRIEPHKNFMITVKGTFIFRWDDEFLKYDYMNPQGTKSLRVMTNEIWVPDLTVYNVVETPMILNHMSACILFPSGQVLCKRRFSLDMYCKMDYKMWPHDTQFCNFYIGSWIENRIYMVKGFRDKGFYLDMVDSNRRWIIKNISVVGETPVANYLTYTFELQRRDEEHYQTYISPAKIVAVISLLPFVVPRDRFVVRISVALVALTLNALFIQALGFSILGWSGDTVPRIAEFFRDGMILNAISVLVFGVVCLLATWERAEGSFLGSFGSLFLQNKVSRFCLELGPKAGPAQAIAALFDRAAFLSALAATIWMVVNMVPSADQPTQSV